MKRTVCLLVLLLLVIQPLFSQQKVGSYDYYMKKSKRQRTAGLLLFCGGTALVVAGAVIVLNNTDASDLDEGANGGEGMWLIIPGVAAELASIPLFISAGNNSRKAISLSIGTWKPDLPLLARQERRRLPVISLRVAL